MWLHPASFHLTTATPVVVALFTLALGLVWRAGGYPAIIRALAVVGGLNLLAGVTCGWIIPAAGGVLILLGAGWCRWELWRVSR